MKKLAWVYLAFLVCYGYCSSSLAQLLEEGSTTVTTVETEDLGEGHVDTYTSTTTTITNETTDNILGPNGTGIVSSRYESDMDLDWGGIGSASMPNCNSIFGTGTCGKGTSNSHTTFQQTVDVSQFHIKDGGALSWDLDFYHSQSNTWGYIESKGWDSNNILQWETGRVALEHSNTPTNYSGTYDFSGELSKVFISVGGAKNYYFDNYNYVINYNTITTTTDSWIEIVQPLVSLTPEIMMTDEEFNNLPNDIQQDIEMNMEQYDMVTTINLPGDVGTTSDVEIQLPEIEISEQFQEVMVEVETFVQEIKELDLDIPDEPNIEISAAKIESTAPTDGPGEPLEESGIVEVPSKSASNEENPSADKVEVAEKEPESKEIVEESTTEVEPGPKKEVAAGKKSIEEKKQEKAEKIINSFESPYQDITGVVTLRIMDALSADINVYQNQTIEDVAWYTQQEFYQDNFIPDPYGNYMSVRSALDMEEMIASQYE